MKSFPRTRWRNDGAWDCSGINRACQSQGLQHLPQGVYMLLSDGQGGRPETSFDKSACSRPLKQAVGDVGGRDV